MQVGQTQNLKILHPADDSMKDKEKWLFGMQKLAPRRRGGSPAPLRQWQQQIIFYKLFY